MCLNAAVAATSVRNSCDLLMMVSKRRRGMNYTRRAVMNLVGWYETSNITCASGYYFTFMQ